MNYDVLEAYKTFLQKQPISALTRRSYLQRVKTFLHWLEGVPDGSLALSDSREQDFQLREFKSFLLQRGTGPSTVNSMLCALDNFFLSRGMKPSKLRRLDLPKQSPRALLAEEEKRLSKALLRVSQRNRVLIAMLWHTGLRISELAALNIGDLTLTARTGQVLVRCGKGLKQRVVPINAELRAILQEYMSSQLARAEHEALFLSQKKKRLSLASIDRIVRQVGALAGIELSAHDLRHDFVSKLVRNGVDVVLVAELTGHARLETVRRYSLPTEAEKQEALEKLCRHAS